MNLGIGELLAVVLNLVLLASIPAIAIVLIALLVRRLRNLESRIASLEERSSDANLARPDE